MLLDCEYDAIASSWLVYAVFSLNLELEMAELATS